MFKKTTIVFGVLGLIQIMILACCPDPITYYNSINDLEIANCSLQTVLLDSVTVSRNEYRIRLRINEETFAQNLGPSFLMNSVYATSCEDNFVGLKSDVSEFKISCNKSILGTQAGEPIDLNKVRVYKIGFTDDSKNVRMSIAEWLQVLNNGGYLLAFEWYLEFEESINTNEYLKFNVQLKQEDGSEFNVETQAVKIE